jgi:hypothetical protein
MPLWENPEFIRNCRAQLRPAKLIGAAIIVALLSWVTAYSMEATAQGNPEWAKQYTAMALSFLLAVLGLGGGLACGLSIYRERERNTFDFQRVTRLTPMELTLGKLFGAPVFAYFLAACLLPAAIYGAVKANLSASYFLTGLVIIVVGCVTFHALGLLVSLASPRGGSGVPGALLLFLLLGMIPPAMGDTNVRTGGPWAGVLFAIGGTWQTVAHVDPRARAVPYVNDWTDLVFGYPVHHVPVLLFLYLTILAWLLLALARNIKRDSSDIELYSPAQSVGVLVYVNVVVMAFFRMQEWATEGGWGPAASTTVLAIFTGLNLFLLYFLGLTLLRGRDQSRRRVYEVTPSRSLWLEAFWPTGYVLAAAAIVALLVITRFTLAATLRGTLDRGLAAFQVAFLLVTVVRDLSYFQWMKLRRSRYPLAMAVLFLGVFVTCSVVVLNTLGWMAAGKQEFLAAVPLPWFVLALDQHSWAGNQAAWIFVLGVQLALWGLFAWLHYRKLAEMAPARSSQQTAAASAAPSGI